MYVCVHGEHYSLCNLYSDIPVGNQSQLQAQILSTNYIHLQLKIQIAFLSMKKYTTKMIATSLTLYTPLFVVNAPALVIKEHWGNIPHLKVIGV